MTISDATKEKVAKILPLLIFASGCMTRLIFLASIPGGLHQDECFVAWNAYALLQDGMDSAGHVWPVYMADWGDGHSALYVWLLIPLLALNGGKVTPFLSRLPQAMVSCVTLLAVYCLVKKLCGKNMGVWSLFLLSICPWHVMMSRWGLDANLAPGFLVFGLLFFVEGVEKKPFLLLSGFFYGLSLYCYAVIWPIVPIMLLLQIVYCLYHRKLRVDKWSVGASVILFVMALPLLLFVLVNAEVIPEICLPFMTIPKMGGYRGGEIAFDIRGMYRNLRAALAFLLRQNTGAPADVLMPYGLFYDIGRMFIVTGAVALTGKVLRSLRKKQFVWEMFLFIPLLGGVINCMLVTVVLHQINSLYVPLVICEGYGVMTVVGLVKKRSVKYARIYSGLTVAVYLISFGCFQSDYYTSYKALVSAYYHEGVEECIDYALEKCEEQGITTLSVEKGAQWPRVLLYTETTPKEYLSSVVYDVAPAPASFIKDGIHINTRVNYENIDDSCIYIIYESDVDKFRTDFEITQFYYWYVAVPK